MISTHDLEVLTMMLLMITALNVLLLITAVILVVVLRERLTKTDRQV